MASYQSIYTGEEIDALIGSGAKIVTGTYTGTGTYGSSATNSLTFDIAPQYIVIRQYNAAVRLSGARGNNRFVGVTSSTDFIVVVTWGTTTVTWYSTASAAYQLNESGTVYTYFAIGT